MSLKNGWAGKILFINLSDQSTRIEATEKYMPFIGGRGINQWLLFELVEKGAHGLDPENVLILGAGPMVGTLVPSAGRLAVDYLNVITGGVGSGNCGGRFAVEMKNAGYDHIVFTGKADNLTYVFIQDDKIHFRDASCLSGLGTWDSDAQIKLEEKDRRLSTLTIGVAGENLVKFASIIGDRGRAVGYGGSGAVMGSKNLKGIAVRGRNTFINVADPKNS
jgi:aldehyde:ferredoxin oxidoreductase